MKHFLLIALASLGVAMGAQAEVGFSPAFGNYHFTPLADHPLAETSETQALQAVDSAAFEEVAYYPVYYQHIYSRPVAPCPPVKEPDCLPRPAHPDRRPQMAQPGYSIEKTTAWAYSNW